MIDEQGITICDRCGQPLNVGEYPFCPHGHGGSNIARDEIPGGIVVENYGPKPIRFDSHSDRRAYMKANGLQEREKFAPLPGTDKDPQGIPNPRGYVDQQTMENAKTLILRAQGALKEPEIDTSRVIQGQFNLPITGRDARAVIDGDNLRRAARVGRRSDANRHSE